MSHGRLTLDENSREVTLDGTYVPLTQLEFDILARLMRTPRFVIRPEVLMEEIWHDPWLSDSHQIEVHISRLRNKLGESGRKPRFIHTVRGVGYRFEPSPPTTNAPTESLATTPSSTFLLVSRHGVITWASPSTYALLAWKEEDLAGRHMQELFSTNGTPFPFDFGESTSSIPAQARQRNGYGPTPELKLRIRPVISNGEAALALVELSAIEDKGSDLTGPLPVIVVNPSPGPTTLNYDELLILRSMEPSDQPFLDWRPGELCNTFFLLVTDPAIRDNQSAALALVQTMLDGGLHMTEGTILTRTASGAITSVHVQSHLYADADGRFNGMRTKVYPPLLG
jgi:DNA-binding winged helix-turn-helix (wHTH) protein